MTKIDVIEREKCRAIYAAARRKAEVKGIDARRMALVALAESLADTLDMPFESGLEMAEPVIRLSWEFAQLAPIARADAAGEPAEAIEEMQRKRREESLTSGLAKMGVSLELKD